MNLLDLYVQDTGHTAKRQAGTNGGEFAGPCPLCGGDDRFRIWPETGRWWCRGCDLSGDLPGYFMKVRGMSYPDALAALGMDQGQGATKANIKPKAMPGPEWQTKALTLVSWAQEQLASPAGADARAYLASRGLSMETARAAGLGLVPSDMWRAREAWGLPREIKANGKAKALWIPEGLVIPTFGPAGNIARVKIRRWSGEPRYYALPGSEGRALVAGAGQVVVVESELDALLIAQEAGDLATAIALGSAQARPDSWAAGLVAEAPRVLIALDYDQAGAKAAWGWWLKEYPQAERWPVPEGKDPTEYRQTGGSVRDWIMAALEPVGCEPGAHEVNGWPLATQRVFVAVLDYMEAKGYPLAKAEALTFEVMRQLQARKGSRGLCLVSDLQPELGKAVGLALEVFPEAEAEWRPGRRRAK